VQVFFRDGSSTDRVAVEYPVGHRRRREEGIPLLLKKFERNLRGRIPSPQADTILTLCSNRAALEASPVCDFMDLFVV
jgi:2-methylcitrate dehydratase PrpD